MVSDGTILKSDGVSYRLSIVTIRPNLPSDVSISDAQINREWVTLGQNMGRKELFDGNKILTQYGRCMQKTSGR